MSILKDNIELFIEGKKLITNSDIIINENNKYALIGKNGCGKTTLLKYLFDKIKYLNYDVLMIDQDIELEYGDDQSIHEFILNADPDLYEKYKLTKNSTDLDLITYVYNTMEWEKYNAESFKIINGLGFTNINMSVSTLSGGERLKLALGKSLLRKPEILLLDEPTNHLDLNNIIWLTSYLTSYKKTVIFITHERDFIDSIANIIWYIGNIDNNIDGNRLYSIDGNYGSYIQFINEKYTTTLNKYNKDMKIIKELKTNSTPKKKAELETFLKKNNINRPIKPYTFNLEFENIERECSDNVILFDNVSYSYPNGRQILNNIGDNFSVGFNSRHIIVGKNGSGKTTLFKLCSGEYIPTEGRIIRDDRVRIAYYQQQIIDNLPLDISAIDLIKACKDNLNEEQCRSKLGKLNIKGNQCTIPIKNLSGGQKARVALCKIQLNDPHIILMDEPTNHLDIESIEGLIHGINSFNGGIIIITHNIHLIKSINKINIFEIKNGLIIPWTDNIDDFILYAQN